MQITLVLWDVNHHGTLEGIKHSFSKKKPDKTISVLVYFRIKTHSPLKYVMINRNAPLTQRRYYKYLCMHLTVITVLKCVRGV